ncbi:MAG: hypothetical protein E7294_09170 [Lachnospiraceae bacterium]|nr:hypothetical protein [Lachnospiraceae bacterium]
MLVEEGRDLLTCRYSRIYVLCPAYHKTGGPEVAHQLVYWINNLGGDAYIAYGNTERYKIWTNKELYKYVRGHVTRYEDISDIEENLVIVPESAIDYVFMTKKVRIFLWWLSVDNLHTNVDVSDKRELLGCIDQRVDKHLVQSAYAADFLKKNGIDRVRISRLADYLNDTYLNNDIKKEKKENIVVFNPKKGVDFTKKIILNAQNIKFVPLSNMTTEEVHHLLMKAKVYIDFGNHPGKDRIPREAVMSGCVVITGKRGSAAFYEDVPIPEEFKFEDDEKMLDSIIGKINESLERYEKTVIKYRDYQKRISGEKAEFIEDVKCIFFDSEAELNEHSNSVE